MTILSATLLYIYSKYKSRHLVIICTLTNVKYLGVIIDYKLNWTQHIAHVKNKISKGIGIMYRARNYLSQVSMRKLYYSYIYHFLFTALKFGVYLLILI